MKYQIVLILFLNLIPIKIYAECNNYSGYWNTLGKHDPRNASSKQIIQEDCEELEFLYHLYIKGGETITEKTKIKINDKWKCDAGSPDKMKCSKARWREDGELLITFSVFEEECLAVVDIFFENSKTMKGANSLSCNGRSPSGYWRQFKVDESK